MIGEALQIHCARRTSNCTSSAALTNSFVNGSNTADSHSSVRLSEFLVGIGDSAVGANLFTGGAAVAHKLIGMSNAGISCELVLGEKTDNLSGSGTCLRNSLGDILGSLAYA